MVNRDMYKMEIMGDDGTFEGGWTAEKGKERAKEWNASLDEQTARERAEYDTVMERLKAVGVEIKWHDYSSSPSMTVTINGDELPEVGIVDLAY